LKAVRIKFRGHKKIELKDINLIFLSFKAGASSAFQLKAAKSKIMENTIAKKV